MEKIGEKFIDGRIVNLDKEEIENLERYAQNTEKREKELKTELDELITQMINK